MKSAISNEFSPLTGLDACNSFCSLSLRVFLFLNDFDVDSFLSNATIRASLFTSLLPWSHFLIPFGARSFLYGYYPPSILTVSVLHKRTCLVQPRCVFFSPFFIILWLKGPLLSQPFTHEKTTPKSCRVPHITFWIRNYPKITSSLCNSLVFQKNFCWSLRLTSVNIIKPITIVALLIRTCNASKQCNHTSWFIQPQQSTHSPCRHLFISLVILKSFLPTYHVSNFNEER